MGPFHEADQIVQRVMKISNFYFHSALLTAYASICVRYHTYRQGGAAT